MSKTRFVAFATQKGGIGKSTITALVANYFHNVKGFNVAVIDCDEPQYNLADLRDEELELIKVCSSLSTIRFSTHDCQTANVSEESCRRTERQCSVPPSFHQTQTCCEGVASRSCPTRFVKS